MNRSSFLKAADLQCIYSLGVPRDITSLVNRLIYEERITYQTKEEVNITRLIDQIYFKITIRLV